MIKLHESTPVCLQSQQAELHSVTTTWVKCECCHSPVCFHLSSVFDVIYLVDEFSHELYLLAESNMQHVSAILRSLAAMLGITVLLYDSNLS